MTRYHAHPNGYLTIDNDPMKVLEISNKFNHNQHPDVIRQQVILSELASDGNKAREWAARAAEIVAGDKGSHSIARLLTEMAEYHRGKAS